MLPHKGFVVWFDEASGEGVIQADNGALLYVHYSCITPWDGFSRRNLKARARVAFSVYENTYSSRIEECTEVIDAA